MLSPNPITHDLTSHLLFKITYCTVKKNGTLVPKQKPFDCVDVTKAITN